MQSIDANPFFCSWSGGKDSCLALYCAIRQGGKPRCLLTMLDETGTRSHSHRLPKSLIEQQAERLGLPVIFRSATWNEYESEFISALLEMKNRNIHAGVFGDIDVESHRDWVLRVCAAASVVPYHPLWQRNRRELLEKFIRLNFKSMIVVVKDGQLDKSFIGRNIDELTIADLEEAGIDPSGELGEYHTVVIDGPIFSSEIHVRKKDRIVHDGYWFLDLDSEKHPAVKSLAGHTLCRATGPCHNP